MRISDAFPSKYLKAADLPHEVAVTIARIVLEDVSGDGSESRPVIYFEGKRKGLVLNRTNAHTIEQQLGYGDDTDGWIGQPLTLFPTSTTFRGSSVPCIRIRPRIDADGNVRATPPPAPAPILDAEIPF